MSAPAGAFSVFPHCRSSVCSLRSLFCISPLPQQCLLPQERYQYFPTAAAVSAPAGALSVFSHCRSSARSSRSLSPPGPSPPCYPNSLPLPSPNPPTTAYSLSQQPHATTGIPTSGFLHCRNSACSSRNLLYISPLPQQCSLQQEPFSSRPLPSLLPKFPPPSITQSTHNGPFPFPTAPRHHRNPHQRFSSLPQQCLLQQEPSLYFPTAAAVPAPAGAFSIFSPMPQQCLLPQERYLYFPTASVVSAPAGALSVFPHCRSSVCSRRSAICFFPLPQQCSLQQEPFSSRPLPSLLPKFPPPSITQSTHNGLFPFPTAPRHHRNPHQRFSSLPQQCLLQQEPSLYFPTAAAVPAPAGAFSIFSPMPQQCLLPQERYLYFPTASVVSAPAGALSVFPHCRSSVCSRRSALCISPLPQQCLLPQERYLYFPTAAAVLAPAGAFSPPGPSPPRYPNPPPLPSTTHNGPFPLPFPTAPRHHRNPHQLFSSLPQQCLLQQEPSLYFPTAAAVPAPAGTFSIFPHCHSSDCSRRSTICISPLPQ